MGCSIAADRIVIAQQTCGVIRKVSGPIRAIYSLETSQWCVSLGHGNLCVIHCFTNWLVDKMKLSLRLERSTNSGSPRFPQLRLWTRLLSKPENLTSWLYTSPYPMFHFAVWWSYRFRIGNVRNSTRFTFIIPLLGKSDRNIQKKVNVS